MNVVLSLVVGDSPVATRHPGGTPNATVAGSCVKPSRYMNVRGPSTTPDVARKNQRLFGRRHATESRSPAV